ncbi:hypothetical protein LPB136_03625 [Tenacibaculum todarodis]|uniref:Uncharacterized protein n=1 Tax=Tenacibaculum todarodis TaxID=1850252 RepID=A0A1L3JH96_9FLAO|nr:hypothetical protein [Tenacibaculum todarodis]APG64508.1 hypothetical protein LPB136_03625 [Tenacibaculum todarodis]
MSQNYFHIATIYFNHEYFKDKIFKHVEFYLDEDSNTITKNLGIFFKPNKGNLQIFATNPRELVLENSAISFRVSFRNNTSEYISYTDIKNYFSEDKILYFSNSDSKFNVTKNTFLLHSEDFVDNNDTKTIKEIRKEGLINQNNKPLGILEFFVQDLFRTYIANSVANYAVNFKTKHTVWRYFIINNSTLKLEDVSIIQKGKGVVFKEPIQETLANGQKALVFESNNKIPLLEYSEETYQLIENYNSNLGPERIIISSLPIANPKQLKFNTSNTTYYSHMYIYI